MYFYGENLKNGNDGDFKSTVAATMVVLEKNRLQQTCREFSALQVCRGRFFFKSTMLAAAAAIKNPPSPLRVFPSFNHIH